MNKLWYFFFLLPLAASCVDSGTVVSRQEHAFLPFGTGSGQLGIRTNFGPRTFPLDQELFTRFVCLEQQRVTFLDTYNNKLLQIDLEERDDKAVVRLEKKLPPLDTQQPPQRRWGTPKPRLQAAYLHIACNDDSRIYFVKRDIQDKGIAYTVFHLKDENSTPEPVIKREAPRHSLQLRYRRVDSYERVCALYSLEKDTIALLWDRQNEEEEIRLSRLEIINTRSRQVRVVSLASNRFVPADPKAAPLRKVAGVYPNHHDHTLLVEAHYGGGGKGQSFLKSLYTIPASGGDPRPLSLPTRTWEACYGVANDNQLYLLQYHEQKPPLVRAVFLLYSLENGRREHIAIQVNPVKSYLSKDFILGSDGRLFSFRITMDGIRLLSWK